MGQKLYQQDNDGIRFSTERRPGEVRIPNYVYDLWLPLLGATAIGVYGVYCRLERGDSVKAITLADIAGSCRIGTGKLEEINNMLVKCGFISVKKPTKQARLMHWTTEITVKDPPREITREIVNLYAPPRGYSSLCPWLTEENQNLPGFSEEPNQAADKNLPGSPNIATLDLLQPLEVAKDICSANAEPLLPGMPEQVPLKAPTEQQQLFGAVAGALRIPVAAASNGQAGRIGKLVNRLKKGAYTVKDIMDADRFWWTDDWRGKQGQPPTDDQLVQTMEMRRKARQEDEVRWKKI